MPETQTTLESGDGVAVMLALGERLEWEHGNCGFFPGAGIYSYRVDYERGVYFARFWDARKTGSPQFESQAPRLTETAAKAACEIHAAIGKWEF